MTLENIDVSNWVMNETEVVLDVGFFDNVTDSFFTDWTTTKLLY